MYKIPGYKSEWTNIIILIKFQFFMGMQQIKVFVYNRFYNRVLFVVFYKASVVFRKIR